LNKIKRLKETNELNLIELILADGSPIIDGQVYKCATNNFLVDGGDDFRDLCKYFINVKTEDILISR